MAQALVVGNGTVVASWADTLRKSRLEVLTASDPEPARAITLESEPEIVVIDLRTQNAPEAMLIPFVRSNLPSSQIIAVVSSYSFNSADAHQLGIWLPDQILVAPVPPRLLSSMVQLMLLPSMAETELQEERAPERIRRMA